MAILDFLRRGKKVSGVVHFNHKTDQADQFQDGVEDYCNKHKLDLYIKYLAGEKDETSWESFWSKQRNAFYKSFSTPVVTGHHLDDSIEWWLFTALRGEPKLMPSKSDNVIRPFLSTKKEALISWVKRHNVPYVEDLSNNDTKFARNYIRHNLVPACYTINPGLQKTIRKKLEKRECS